MNPNGQDATNTITRAELSALAHAIELASAHDDALDALGQAGTARMLPAGIYTDSLASLHLVRKILLQPFLLRESKHRAPLEHIRSLLLARARQERRTHLYKVKSHSGVSGNECADEAAVKVAKGRATEHSNRTDNDPYSGLWWLRTGGRYVSDLTSSVKRSVAAHTDAGFSNLALYGKLWADALPTLDARASHGMWTAAGAGFANALLVLKYRWGTLYTRKHAARYGHVPAGMTGCPLCRKEDGGTHILAGCDHHDMKALYISRHNAAVRRIAKTIMRGSHADAYMVMDACAQNALPAYAAATRIPPWLLPGVADQVRNKYRPDILLVKGLTRAELERDPPQPDGAGVEIHIVELGYCGDLRHTDKRTDKWEQHVELVKALKAAGWSVTYAPPITLGVGGTVCADFVKTMQGLGAAPDSARMCAARLHAHAVHTAGDIIRVRRAMERNLPPVPATDRPP